MNTNESDLHPTADTHEIERLVQLLAPGVRPKTESKTIRLWTKDCDSGEFFAKRPFLAALRPSHYSTWLVRSVADLALRPQRISIVHQDGSESAVDVQVTLNTVDPQSDPLLLQCLAGSDDPQGSWLEEVETATRFAIGTTAEDGLQLEDFQARKNRDQALATAVQTQLAERMGLATSVIVEWLGIDGLFPFPPVTLDGLLEDVDQPLQLQVEYAVRPLTNRRPYRAHPVAPEEIHDRCQSRILEDLRSIPLQTYLYEPENMRKSLEGSIEESLALFGLQVAYLRILKKESLALDVPDQVRHTVECRVQPQSTLVKIHHEMLVSLRNAAELKRADLGDTQEWIQRLLEEVTQEELFGHNIIDLILDFEPHKTRIERNVRRVLKSVGFNIRQFVSDPDVTIRKLVHGFRIQPFSESFHTRDSRVEFELRVQISGRITKLEHLRDVMSRTNDPERHFDDVLDHFRSIARESIADELQLMWPDELYLYFEHGRPSEKSGESNLEDSPRARIERAIAKRFDKEFKAEEFSATVTPQDAQFGRRFRDLVNGKHRKLELWIEPFEELTERIPFTIEYRIKGLTQNGWYLFQNTVQATLGQQDSQMPSGAASGAAALEDHEAQIRESLRTIAIRNLKTLPLKVLRYENIDLNRMLQTKVFTEAIQQIREFFGLEVVLISVDRSLSRIEVTQRLVSTQQLRQVVRNDAASIQDLTSRLQKLRADRAAMDVTDKDSLETIDAIDSQISELEQRLKSHSATDLQRGLLRARGSARKTSTLASLDPPSPQDPPPSQQRSQAAMPPIKPKEEG